MADEPDKVDLETPDLAAENRAALSSVCFPACSPTASSTLRDSANCSTPRWPQAARRSRAVRTPVGGQAGRGALPAHAQPRRTCPDLENSIDFDAAENVFIEGDNLEVLKLLQKAYNDKVKLIYIDPPYNTGNDFVYHDDFRDGLRGYLEYTGQLDDEGNRTSANAETAGRRHSRGSP